MHESSLFISNPILVAGKVDGSTVNSSKDMPANTCLDRWPIARTGDRRGEPCLVFGNLSTACKLDWSSYESPMKANLLFIEASPSAEQQAWTSLPTLVLVFLLIILPFIRLWDSFHKPLIVTFSKPICKPLTYSWEKRFQACAHFQHAFHGLFLLPALVSHFSFFSFPSPVPCLVGDERLTVPRRDLILVNGPKKWKLTNEEKYS